jgi:hypothetical protein
VVQSVIEMAFLFEGWSCCKSIPYRQLGHLSTKKHENSMKYAG